MAKNRLVRERAVYSLPTERLTEFLLGGVTSLGDVKKAATVAARYSIVRKQHGLSDGCLMDYSTQQERIIGAISEVYCLHFTAQRLREFGSANLHNLVAGLKGALAFWEIESTYRCVLCVDAHGFSRYSEVSNMIGRSLKVLPSEGDAIVMIEQAARYLTKQLGRLSAGELLEEDSVSYLNSLRNGNFERSENSGTGHFSSRELLEAACWTARSAVSAMGKSLAEEEELAGDPAQGWNNSQLELVYGTKAHIFFSAQRSFYDALDTDLPSALAEDGGVLLPILRQLADLSALRYLDERMVTLLEGGYFAHAQVRQLRRQIKDLYKSLRPYVVALTDAWGISDEELATPLGRYDGESL